MKKHYQTLGLEEGASQEAIQQAYDKLSVELDPKNNDNQDFFIEEYAKLQEAYKVLSNSNILTTEKGATGIKNEVSSTAPFKKKNKKSANKKKKNIVYPIVFGCLIAATFLVYFFYLPMSYYKKGEEFLNDKEFKEAINQMNQVREIKNGYKKTDSLLVISHFGLADDYYEKGLSLSVTDTIKKLDFYVSSMTVLEDFLKYDTLYYEGYPSVKIDAYLRLIENQFTINTLIAKSTKRYYFYYFGGLTVNKDIIGNELINNEKLEQKYFKHKNILSFFKNAFVIEPFNCQLLKKEAILSGSQRRYDEYLINCSDSKYEDYQNALILQNKALFLEHKYERDSVSTELKWIKKIKTIDESRSKSDPIVLYAEARRTTYSSTIDKTNPNVYNRKTELKKFKEVTNTFSYKHGDFKEKYRDLDLIILGVIAENETELGMITDAIVTNSSLINVALKIIDNNKFTKEELRNFKTDDLAGFYRARGSLKFKMKDWKGVITDLEKAIEIYRAEIGNGLSPTAFQLRNYRIRKYKDLYIADMYQLLFAAKWNYGKNGDKLGACDDLRMAADISPNTYYDDYLKNCNE